eukprot:6468910-Amphidinium_carterae.1
MAGVSAADLSLLGASPSLGRIMQWAQLTAANVAGLLGVEESEVTDVPLSTFAMFTVVEYEKMVEDWAKKGASTLELARARLLRAACIALSGSLPVASNSQAQEVVPVAATATSTAKKIKTSSVIDVTDESEIPVATPDKVKVWFKNYSDLKGGMPMVDHEPSPEQISALEARVVIQKMEPYADFSLLTPFGRRMAKTLRLRSWIPQEDGSYKPADVPGPPDFASWAACYKVYSAALLML